MAYQLAISLPSPSYQERYGEALRRNPLAVKNLIVDPILPFTQTISTVIVVIDGLDECEENDAIALIGVLLSMNSASPLPIRFFITSRADDAVQQALKLHSPMMFLGSQPGGIRCSPNNGA
jgi:hypothetical protein